MPLLNAIVPTNGFYFLLLCFIRITCDYPPKIVVPICRCWLIHMFFWLHLRPVFAIQL